MRRLRRTALRIESSDGATVMVAGKKKVERISFVHLDSPDLDEWFESEELEAALEALQ